MHHYFKELGFANDLTFLRYCNSSPFVLQTYTDKICQFLLGGSIDFDKKECEYLGGFKLKIPTAYIETKCHHLETVILEKLPELRKYYSNLKKSVVLEVLKEQPSYISKTVYDVFLAIIAKEAH